MCSNTFDGCITVLNDEVSLAATIRMTGLGVQIAKKFSGYVVIVVLQGRMQLNVLELSILKKAIDKYEGCRVNIIVII